MRLFFDTEFTDLKQDCELISIGVVADNGIPGSPKPCFYAESMDFSEDKCSDFVKKNVLPHLALARTGKPQTVDVQDAESVAMYGTEEDIAMQLDKWIKHFLEPTEMIEIWSDCLAYDWVLFCNLFDHIGGLPSYIYYIPFDLSTYLKLKNIDPDISREEFASKFHSREIAELIGSSFGKHNSLFDAMVIYYCHNTLTNYIN